MSRGSPFDIAVVGGGACGLAVLLNLVGKGSRDMRIAVFEKNSSIGPGLAYSKDCAGTRVNMHSKTMSLYANDSNHFVRWMQNNPPATGEQEYPHREHYGKYLREIMADVNQQAQEKGITLVVHRTEVIDMERKLSNSWTIHTGNGHTFQVSHIVLALGNFMNQVYKHLENKHLYFHNPWPNSRLHEVPRTASVAIVGSQLTAIDAALYLTDNGYTGHIYLVSRTGRLPKVQAKVAKKHERAYAVHNLARELESNHQGAGSIITIARRLHDEMSNWSSAHKSNETRISKPDNPISQLKHDLEAAQKGIVPGQVVLRETAPVIERYWRSLDDFSKSVFLKEYMSMWTIHRHAMPLRTAERLLEVLERGQLTVHRLNPQKQATYRDPGFSIPTSSDGKLQTDALIEATGMQYDATCVQAPLIRNLLSRKILTAHPIGGVNVDHTTLQATRQQGLYVIGSMTRGVHFYSTAIDRNVAHAKRLADAVLGFQPRKPLHIALFVSSDLFSQLIVSKLVPLLTMAGHVPFIYLTEASRPTRRLAEPAGLRELAFYERDLLQSTIIPYLDPAATVTGPCLTIPQLRVRYGLLVTDASDVNDTEFIRSLSANHIDIGLNIHGHGRRHFKMPAISYFQSDDCRGLFNLHPGRLPAYGGMMTLMRAIANGEAEFGYTLQEIAAEDTGHADTVIGMRMCAVDCSKAMLNNMDHIWPTGVDMLASLIEQIARGQTPQRLPQGEGRRGFYALPNQDDLEGYAAQGLSLVDGEGIKTVLLTAFTPDSGDKGLQVAIEDACREKDGSLSQPTIFETQVVEKMILPPKMVNSYVSSMHSGDTVVEETVKPPQVVVGQGTKDTQTKRLKLYRRVSGQIKNWIGGRRVEKV